MLTLATVPTCADELDRQVEQQEQEALELAQQALALAQPMPESPNRALNVYVGARVSAVTLVSISIVIDDAPVASHTSDEEESRAITHGELCRVLRTEVTPGTHRIRAELAVRDPEATSGDRPVPLSLDTTFDGSAGSLELSVAPAGWHSGVGVRLYPWQLSDGTPAQAWNLAHGQSQIFVAGEQRPFIATSTI